MARSLVLPPVGDGGASADAGQDWSLLVRHLYETGMTQL